MATATYVAVAINVSGGGASPGCSPPTSYRVSEAPAASTKAALGRRTRTRVADHRFAHHLSTSRSGCLGSRRSAPRSSGRASCRCCFGGTVYTFSLIAAAFLCGLGIGSAAGAWLARDSQRPGTAAGRYARSASPSSVAWGAALINRAFPYWPIDPGARAGPVVQLPDRSRSRAFIADRAGRVLLGRELSARARRRVAARRDDPARLVGDRLCRQHDRRGRRRARLQPPDHSGLRHAGRAATADLDRACRVGRHARVAAAHRRACSHAGRRAAWRSRVARHRRHRPSASVAPVPPDVIAYGRQIATFKGASFLYEGEGLNSSIAVSESEGGVRNFHVSGKVEASTEVHDMRLQRMLGHMSALMHPDPQSVLVVGFGAGVTAGSFVLHPGIKRIVICEIEPLIPRMVAPYFSKENYDVVHDPRVEIVYDDARHYILTTNEKFDIITSDPIHPWVKGAASLYTKEYFELVKSHLNPGGVVTQWVPLYQSTRRRHQERGRHLLRRLSVRDDLEQPVRKRRRLRRRDARQARSRS